MMTDLVRVDGGWVTATDAPVPDYSYEEIQAAVGTGMSPALVNYWVHGKGAVKVGWGLPHDFYRCRDAIQAEASEHSHPLAPNVINGLCSTLHLLATGSRPGGEDKHDPGHRG